jgi:hypothetical protein
MSTEIPTGDPGSDWREPDNSEQPLIISEETTEIISQIKDADLRAKLTEYATLQEKRIVLRAAGMQYEAAQIGVQMQNLYSGEILPKLDEVRGVIAIGLIDQRGQLSENTEDDDKS